MITEHIDEGKVSGPLQKELGLVMAITGATISLLANAGATKPSPLGGTPQPAPLSDVGN